MKTYKTVQEWIASNPSKESVAKVLTVVNRSVVSESRKILRDKTYEWRRIQSAIKAMGKVNLPITKEIQEKVTTLKKEIEDLQKSIPPSPYVKKEVKEEKKVK